MTVEDPQENYITGWIKIFRSVRDHWIWEDSDYFKAWISIIIEVNHKDNKTFIRDKIYECKRGQKLYSLSTWSKVFSSKKGKRWSRQNVRTFFKLLEKDNMIATKGDQNLTTLTVCNYDSYQHALTIGQPTPNQRLTNGQPQLKNDKNDKNDKNKRGVFIKPSLEDIKIYCTERKNSIDPQSFIDHYVANGWKVGRNSMKDWQAAVRTWEGRENGKAKYNPAL